MNIFEFEQLLLAQIDNLVANGSDDELFASGYLRIYFTGSCQLLEMHGRTHTRDVEMSVLRGLQQACLNGNCRMQIRSWLRRCVATFVVTSSALTKLS